jgi:hypothetical protein
MHDPVAESGAPAAALTCFAFVHLLAGAIVAAAVFTRAK